MQDINSSSWNICGQERIIEFLRTAIKNGKVSHAYLFCGPEHLGKYTVAKEFAAALMCGKDDLSCQECFNCRQLKNNTHPDVWLVERMFDEKTEKLKKDISVEQIRDLKNRLQQASFFNGYKIAMIPEAQRLNHNAVNTLLKVLEEPTKKTIIILMADSLNRIPQTIVSRSQVLRFLPVSAKRIEAYLTLSGVEDILAKRLAHVSSGRPGIALSFWRDKESWSQHEQAVKHFFSVIDSNVDKKFALADRAIDWNKDESINIKNLHHLFDSWQSVIRDLLLFKTDNKFLMSNIDFTSDIDAHGDYFSMAKILNMTRAMNQSRALVRQNINSKIILENLLLTL